ASSSLALSYGTFDLTAGGAVTSIASLKIKSGANNSCGTAVLGSNGSVNVANTYVAAGDLIFLTDQTPGGTLGDLELGGIHAGSWGNESPARAELWERGAKLAKDGWLLICDADMLLQGDPRPLVASWECNAWAFALVDLWDSERTFRIDGPWAGGPAQPRPW